MICFFNELCIQLLIDARYGLSCVASPQDACLFFRNFTAVFAQIRLPKTLVGGLCLFDPGFSTRLAGLWGLSIGLAGLKKYEKIGAFYEEGRCKWQMLAKR